MLAGVIGWPHTKSWWATTATPGSRWRTAPQTWWVTTVTFEKPSTSRRYSKGGNYYHSANLLSSSVIMRSLCKPALCSVSFLCVSDRLQPYGNMNSFLRAITEEDLDLCLFPSLMSWEAAVNTDDPQADGNLIAAHCQNVVPLPLKRFVCVIVVDRNTKH